MRIGDLIVRKNSKGRGVYAGRSFRAREVITVNPVIIFPDGDAKLKGIVHRYTFEWDDGISALPLGLGNMMNHSYEPNVVYEFMFTEKAIRFVAHRAIRKGEELVFNYNHDPDDRRPVGFKVR